MEDINRYCCTGRVIREPRMAETPSGSPVMNLSVAVRERWRNAETGAREDRSSVLPVVVFGAYATVLEPLVTKGSLVCLDGSLRASSWVRDGERHTKLQVVADHVRVIGQAGRP